MKKLILVIMAGVAAMATFANADAPTGVGEKLPNLEATNTAGKTDRLHNLIEGKPTVLLFIRSAEWCGYCKKQLTNWNEAMAQFDERGYSIISVSYDSPDVIAAFKKERGIAFDMLSDPDSQTMKSLGILNENIEPGNRAYGIPHPAIYVVDADARITHAFRESDYKNRPKINDVMAELVGTM